MGHQDQIGVHYKSNRRLSDAGIAGGKGRMIALYTPVPLVGLCYLMIGIALMGRERG